MSDGILIAADKKLEWLIPWWWMNYILNTALPVTFIQEEGLTSACETWCKAHSSHKEFDETLWMEPWCQIRGPLEPLFIQSECEALCAVSSESSDVIAFQKRSPLLKEWGAFFQNTSLKYNTFSQREVYHVTLYNELDPVILNWEASLGILKSQIQFLENKFLYRLSF